MASLEDKSNDWDRVVSPAKYQRKRGRPPIQSAFDSTSPGDKNSQRKERVRLAQRAYRNRKDLKVDSLKARVARLEYALEQTIKSFTRFQNLAIGVDNLPPKIALEVSRTALDIALVAQKAYSEDHPQKAISDDGGSGTSPNGQDATEDAVEEAIGRKVWPTKAAQMSNPSSQLTTSAARNEFLGFDMANTASPIGFSTTISTRQNLTLKTPETHRRTWFAARLLRLSLERGVRLLTSPTMTYGDLHPALSIHLNWVTVDELRIQVVRAMANNFEHPPEDLEPSILVYPNMYRSIEGSDSIVVPRMPKLGPQQLVHGRTRTKLDTNFRNFQGEWLEPIDVQEYLEWKGIFLGSSGPRQLLQITIPEATLADIWTQDASAIFAEEIQRSRAMPTLWPFAIEPQCLELEVPDEEVMQSAEFQIPTWAKQNDSLATSNSEESVATQALYEYQTPGYSEQLTGITLHLDRLMGFLVGAACCIGSGPGIRKEAVDHALRVSITVH